jgi:hypothetical protein
VKSKARLGKLVNQKTVTAVAVTAVEKADEGEHICSGALSYLPPLLLLRPVSRNYFHDRRAPYATAGKFAKFVDTVKTNFLER